MAETGSIFESLGAERVLPELLERFGIFRTYPNLIGIVALIGAMNPG